MLARKTRVFAVYSCIAPPLRIVVARPEKLLSTTGARYGRGHRFGHKVAIPSRRPEPTKAAWKITFARLDQMNKSNCGHLLGIYVLSLRCDGIATLSCAHQTNKTILNTQNMHVICTQPFRFWSWSWIFASFFVLRHCSHTLYGPYQCEWGRSARESASYYDGSNVASALVVAVEPPFRRILWLATLRLFACRLECVVVGRFHAPCGSEENAKNDNERVKLHFLLVFYVLFVCMLNNCRPGRTWIAWKTK